jgi:integrase
VEAPDGASGRDEAQKRAAAFLPSVFQKVDFISYLKDFWQPNSLYFREKNAERRNAGMQPLTADYSKQSLGIIKNHIGLYAPFTKIGLHDLTPAMLDGFKLWESERGVAGHRINMAFKVMPIAARYAVNRDILDKDPFRKKPKAAERKRKRGILNRAETLALIETSRSMRPTKRLILMLGMLGGLRSGEMRGLRWDDIGAKKLFIRKQWMDGEGLAAPKCESARNIPVCRELARAVADAKAYQGHSRTGLVFERFKDDAPRCAQYFDRAFYNAIADIGISREEAKRGNLTLHCLRHSFVSICWALGMTESEVIAYAGHRTLAAMEIYTHAGELADLSAGAAALDRFTA